MNKIYSLIAILAISVGVNAQTTKTLTSHTAPAFVGAPPLQAAITIYGTQGGGFVSGNNEYGDKAAIQLFDAATGVSGAGTINSISFYAGAAINTSTTAKFSITIWENDNGEIGNVIATQEINLSSIDTDANPQVIITNGEIGGAYNSQATFTGIDIPANKSFWAGIVYPTTAGDSLAVVTTVPPTAGNATSTVQYTYPLATTHSGVLGITDEVDTYGLSYPLSIANFIFATITVQELSIDELTVNNGLSVYPNPANDVLNFKVSDAKIEKMNVYSTDGKLVMSSDFSGVEFGSINVSELTSGLYIYEVISSTGATSKSTFAKK